LNFKSTVGLFATAWLWFYSQANFFCQLQSVFSAFSKIFKHTAFLKFTKIVR